MNERDERTSPGETQPEPLREEERLGAGDVERVRAALRYLFERRARRLRDQAERADRSGRRTTSGGKMA
jgi:hypothetical protein